MRHFSITRGRILAAALLSLVAAASQANVPHFQGFEDNSWVPDQVTDWNHYDSIITRAASGDHGITAKDGSHFLAITPPANQVDPSGAFTRLGGYSPTFGGGYVVSTDIYIDLSDPKALNGTYGWDLSTSSSTNTGGFLRDFIFHTAVDANGHVLVAADNNSNDAPPARGDLGSINHWTITSSGWYRFQWVFRDFGNGTLAVDCNLLDAANNLLWTETRHDNSDLIASLVGGNRYMWFTFLVTDYLALDNTQVTSLDNLGLPVDLNGSWACGSSLTTVDGFDPNTLVNATTNSNGDRDGNGKVHETSEGVDSQENTYTPFSDANKPPTTLEHMNLRGHSYSADVDLGSLAYWSDNYEFFQLGAGRQVGYEDGTEESFVFIYREGNVFSLYMESNWSQYEYGNQYYAQPDETKFHIHVDYSADGTTATLTVTPLNGARAGTAAVLQPFTLSAADNTTDTSFFAGFTQNGYLPGSARIKVSNFTTTAGSNWQYVYANNPYVRSSDPKTFSMGMAGIGQPIGGFQSYLQSHGSLSFASGAYTASPFPAGHFYDANDGTGRLAGGVTAGTPLVNVNAVLANFGFSGASGTSGWIDILANNGAGLDSQFSDNDGNEIVASRQRSNILLVDDVPPVVTGITATQGAHNVFNAPGIQTGPLHIAVTSSDAITGLLNQPTISITFSSGPAVVLTTVAGAGNNFYGDYTVPANAPNGPATITITAVDRAGNVTTVNNPVNVNTATVTVNLQLIGFAAAGPVTRGITLRFGGSGGSNAPLVLDRDVTFNASGAATVVLNSGDGIPNTSGVVTYLVSAKDKVHTLRSTGTLSGVGNQYSVNLGLRGGDINGADGKVDIGDYVVYATRYGLDVSPNTPLALNIPGYRHADISGDGHVDSVDFSFISSYFGQLDDPDVGQFNGNGGPGEIRTKITVRQAAIEAGPGSQAAVMAMDLNKDGWITIDEITTYLKFKKKS